MSDKPKTHTPEQLQQIRLDQLMAGLNEMYSRIVPQIDRAVTNSYIVGEACKRILIEKNVCTKEEFDKTVNGIIEELREQQEKLIQEEKDKMEAQTGPRVLSKEDLEALANKGDDGDSAP